MIPYINSMKNFFLFCDNLLLNYDPKLLNNASPLINLKEAKFESILIYSNNNFINNNNNDGGMVVSDLIDFSNDKISEISDALFMDDEFIIVAFDILV